MKLDRTKYKRVFAIYFSLVMLFSIFSIVLANPTTFEWGSFDSRGGTNFGVYDQDNVTLLAENSLVQLVWVGQDGVVARPGLDGLPEGDDLILDETKVINVGSLPPPLQNNGYVLLKTLSFDSEAPYQNSSVYLRAWNAASPLAASAYGDSELGMLTSGGVFNASRWYTNKDVELDAVVWVGSEGDDWHNPENWSSGSVPDSNTTVIIRDGNVRLYTNAIADRLVLDEGAMLDLGNYNLSIEDWITNRGRLRQTMNVTAESTAFLQITNSNGTEVKYHGLEINTSDSLQEITVDVQAQGLAVPRTCSGNDTNWIEYDGRCFAIYADSDVTSSVRLFPQSESPNIESENVATFQFSNGSWQPLGSESEDGIDAVNNAADSSELLNGTDPVNDSQSGRQLNTTVIIFIVGLIVFMVAGVLTFRKRRRQI